MIDLFINQQQRSISQRDEIVNFTLQVRVGLIFETNMRKNDKNSTIQSDNFYLSIRYMKARYIPFNLKPKVLINIA